jgi:hypothetical protein
VVSGSLREHETGFWSGSAAGCEARLCLAAGVWT